MTLWPSAPERGFLPPAPVSLALFAVCLLATLTATADAQPRRPRPDAKGATDPKDAKDAKDAAKDSPRDATKDAGKDAKAGGKPKVFDFTGLDLAGRLHTPQLLYFLERANEELERAFLERRSFIPHMVRSVEEEAL
jgi:hypothetical protein